MGCTSSREARRDRRRSTSRFRRNLSLPFIRGSQRKGDSFCVAGLSSLKLDSDLDFSGEEMMKNTNDQKQRLSVGEHGSAEIRETETLVRSSSNKQETETINAWELMDGLEDTSPLRPSHTADFDRSLSFNSSLDNRRSLPKPPPPPLAPPNSSNSSIAASPKPIWMQSISADYIEFDLDGISNFRKTMVEISLQHPALLRSPMRCQTKESSIKDSQMPKFAGIVKARVTAFQKKIDAKKSRSEASASDPEVSPLGKCPPGGEGKLVVYLTSLRGVRKTFEDCWNVRVIIQGYGYRADERDVSIHGGFKDELNEILGYGYVGGRLPRVFANGKYIGGAEEVMQMHEAGELGKALENCQMLPVGRGWSAVACDACSDVRFVPCETCSGSCKVFVEEEAGEAETGGFQRCPDCNENGLVRCRLCCF